MSAGCRPHRSWPRALRATATVLALATPQLAPAAIDGLPSDCEVPETLLQTEAPLPIVAKRLRTAPPSVSIVLLGSGSTAGSGVSTAQFAYPNRLQGWLRAMIPGAEFNIDVIAKRGMTARQMLDVIKRDVVRRRPALVLWQTGAADAGQGLSPSTFGEVLDQGLHLLQANKIDAMLIDFQYSPYTEAFLNSGPYRDYLLWSARRYRVPLFRRHDVMVHWHDQAMFDLTSRDKAVQLQNADRIHDCIAALLARQIELGVRQALEDDPSIASGTAAPGGPPGLPTPPRPSEGSRQ